MARRPAGAVPTIEEVYLEILNPMDPGRDDNTVRGLLSRLRGTMSDRHLRRQLDALVAAGWLTVEVKGRNRHYTAVPGHEDDYVI